MIDYINKILIPYLSVKRKELKLPSNYPALVIFDKFTAQGTDQVLQILQNNNIYFVMVPANEAFLAVFDGHSGKEVAEYASKHL